MNIWVALSTSFPSSYKVKNIMNKKLVLECDIWKEGKHLKVIVKSNLHPDDKLWTGTDISISPLAPASEFLKKGLSASAFQFSLAQIGKLIFWTQHISFIVNGLNTQEYANNMQQNWKENGF